MDMSENSIMAWVHYQSDKIAAGWAHFKFIRRNRSLTLDIILTFFIGFFALFSAIPLYFTVINAFKPISELFLFPPRFYVQNPTLNNFYDLSTAVANSRIVLGRYIFNTLLIMFLGTTGTVLFGSMAAFPLAKYKFPGSKVMGHIIIYSLMFHGAASGIATYYLMAKFGLINTYAAVVLPAMAGTTGLYLMRNFMADIPMPLIEMAKIDGLNEFNIYFSIVMPLSKPAWVTLVILSFQGLWGNTGGTWLYSENLKPFSFMLQQIAAVGIARAGVAGAIGLLMLIVPVTVFVIGQTGVINTMAKAGIKE